MHVLSDISVSAPLLEFLEQAVEHVHVLPFQAGPAGNLPDTLHHPVCRDPGREFEGAQEILDSAQQ